MVGSGYYAMAKDQLKRFRDVDRSPTPPVGRSRESSPRLRKAKFEVTAIDELKTAPRGYAKDHPRVELLRMKGCARQSRTSVRRSGSTPSVRRERIRDTLGGREAD